MYNIAIIDDEWLSVKCIEKILEKHNDFDICVTGITSAGEALEFFRTSIPDIIFIDIRMPEMNGFELIQRVREQINDQVQAIIISGYSDVKYYKKALESNILNYILKPVKEIEILSVLEQAISRAEKQITTKRTINIYKQAYLSSVMNRFLDQEHSFVFELDKSHIDNAISQLSNSFTMEKYTVLVIKFFDAKISESEVTTVKSQLKKWLNGAAKHFTFIRHSDKIVSLINYDQNITSRLQFFMQNIKIKDAVIFAGMGECFKDFRDLLKSYYQAEKKLMNRYLDDSCRLFINNDDTVPLKTAIDNKDNKYHESILEMFYQNDNDIHKNLSKIVIETKYASFQDLSDKMSDICLIVNRKIKEHDFKIPTLNSDNILKSAGSMKELVDILSSTIKLFTKKFRFERKPRQRSKVENSISYIDMNYGQRLTMSSMAHMFDVSPSYYSVLFMEITGKSFTNYLTTLRINEAKTLLRNGNIELIVIAEHIGYKDYFYFCKAFKKFTGFSPSAFRNKELKNEI